jgi:hypothetical protein
VSKNDVGDLNTPDNAALKRFRLAVKLENLEAEGHVSKDAQTETVTARTQKQS